MESAIFRNLVQIESAPSQLPAVPEPVLSKSRSGPNRSPSTDIELDNLQHVPRGHHKQNSSHSTPTPATNNSNGNDTDLEMSRPGSPVLSAAAEREGGSDAFDALPSFTSHPMTKYRYIAACAMSILGGLTDSAPGALIPYMEAYYSLPHSTLSLLFIANAVGWITAAFLVDGLRARLGSARTLGLCQVVSLAGYLPMAVAARSFGTICLGYFLIGLGNGVGLAINNVFCANLARGTTMLGVFHGCYGVGGMVGPLIATAIVTAAGAATSEEKAAGKEVSPEAAAAWGNYYYINVGIAAFDVIAVLWAFWDYERDFPAHTHQQQQRGDASDEDQVNDQGKTKNQIAGLISAFRKRVVLLGAIFIFAYQGAEVSISGWVLSFLISARGGNPARVGYVTSGFWGGVTAGRFILSPLGARWGEKLFVFMIVSGAIIFQVLVWWVPNIIAEAVALAVVGLLLGPVYPCACTIFTRNLSKKEQITGLGIISAFGSSGGAVAPFITGAMAQALGTFVLHPIAIVLFVAMLLAWWGQPSQKKRSE